MAEKSPNGTFVIKWRIENFHMVVREEAPIIWSPTVNFTSLYNTTWLMTLYPNGTDNCEDIICKLIRNNNKDQKEIKVDVTFFLNSYSVEKSNECFKNVSICEFLFKTKAISADDEVIEIQCCLRETNAASTVFENNPKRYPLRHPEKGNRVNNGSLKHISTSIDQCFIRTKILFRNNSIICSIQDFDHKTQKKPILPLLTFGYGYNLIPTLHLKNSEDGTTYLEVAFTFAEILNQSVSVICSIYILDSNRQIVSSFRDSHIFKGNEKPDIWSFHEKIRWNIVETENLQSLCFEFSFSDGLYLSDVKWSGNANDGFIYPSKTLKHNSFLSEMARFYHEKKFCDVILRSEYTAFECHKIVLCAMSPVFAIMFESGMRESATNTVHVEDLDSDTVRQMLDFMYTGSVQELRLETAMSLYSAADKYDIVSLKQICRDFLKQNLNHENVCDILSFSDARNDKELKQSAIHYISVQKKEIMKTSGWKYLADNDIQLAFEVLMTLHSE